MNATNISREDIIREIVYMLERFNTHKVMRTLWYVRRIW